MPAGLAVAQHTTAPRRDPHVLEQEMFAKVVAAQLNAAAARQELRDLILVVPSRILKTICDMLDVATREESSSPWRGIW